MYRSNPERRAAARSLSRLEDKHFELSQRVEAAKELAPERVEALQSQVAQVEAQINAVNAPTVEDVALQNVLAQAEMLAHRAKAVQELRSAVGGPIETADPDKLLAAIEELRPTPEPTPEPEPAVTEDLSDHVDPEPQSLFQRIFGA